MKRPACTQWLQVNPAGNRRLHPKQGHHGHFPLILVMVPVHPMMMGNMRHAAIKKISLLKNQTHEKSSFINNLFMNARLWFP
ncbi:hypothetical protein RAA17_10415 [Komagataeibacter rhaeticus]|nr:hypothetical protein [Komagataeibacter rhaeticus]